MAVLACTSALVGCQSRTITTCEQPGFVPVQTTLPDLALQRLDQAPDSNTARERLAADYLAVSCRTVLSHSIAGSRHNSYACVVPGRQQQKILVGAHYDKWGSGRGIADNWSGVVLTAELLRYFSRNPPNHTLEFVMFGEEEPGMKGSAAYLEGKAVDDYVAMLNVDTLGLGPTLIDARSDPFLKCLAQTTGEALEIVVRTSRLREMTGDWYPFRKEGIRTLNFHSLDARKVRVIHSWRDKRSAVKDSELQMSYRLILNTLRNLDQVVGP